MRLRFIKTLVFVFESAFPRCTYKFPFLRLCVCLLHSWLNYSPMQSPVYEVWTLQELISRGRPSSSMSVGCHDSSIPLSFCLTSSPSSQTKENSCTSAFKYSVSFLCRACQPLALIPCALAFYGGGHLGLSPFHLSSNRKGSWSRSGATLRAKPGPPLLQILSSSTKNTAGMDTGHNSSGWFIHMLKGDANLWYRLQYPLIWAESLPLSNTHTHRPNIQQQTASGWAVTRE